MLTRPPGFLKHVVTAPNISVGDYTYYADPDDPTGFEKNNVLFNCPVFGDRLIIGKFCAIASGTKFIMGAPTTAFARGDLPLRRVPPHPEQLPREGDTVIGNDVWIGRESVILPGVSSGDGAVVAAYSVVTKDVPPYTMAGGNPVQVLKSDLTTG